MSTRLTYKAVASRNPHTQKPSYRGQLVNLVEYDAEGLYNHAAKGYLSGGVAKEQAVAVFEAMMAAAYDLIAHYAARVKFATWLQIRPKLRNAMLKEDLSLPETARLVTRATPLKDLKVNIGGFTLVRDTSAE